MLEKHKLIKVEIIKNMPHSSLITSAKAGLGKTYHI